MTHIFSAALRSRNKVDQVMLSAFTTMKVGGPATMVWLNDRQDIPELLETPHRWLGKGANLLVADAGVAEAVIKLGPALSQLEIQDVGSARARVRAGAGLDLAELMSTCIKSGLAGPEGLAGVPATVGGALRMNAGTSTCWMLDWVSRVEVIMPGESDSRWLDRAELPASYRHSGLPPGVFFLGCELILASADPAVLRANSIRLKNAKAASQPLALASAGCVFKNPAPNLPAGKVIDELGLKTERIGGAVVSDVHANFIVNPERSASAADVTSLIKRIRDRAWRERGVVLQMEVETWNCGEELRMHPRDVRVEVTQ